MPNPHGTPLWYELLTNDPAAAKRFYEAVLPWTVEDQPSGEMDYRMIATPDGLVGGAMRLTGEMREHGARPSWMFYLGVDDVESSVAAARAAGGSVLREPWEIPGVGTIAIVADPQGAPFYLMRVGRDGTSRSFDPETIGKGRWHELTTSDQAGGHAFYNRLFGWTFEKSMPIGDMGDYVFIDAPRGRLGATMRPPVPDMPSHWRFYFRVADIDRAAEAVKRAGGAIHIGPIAVPTGETVILASDPEGATFGLVAL